MKLTIKYDIQTTCRVILQEQLSRLGINYDLTSLGNVEIKGEISPVQYKKLENALRKYGIEIINNPRNAIVQQVKDLITELVYNDDITPSTTMSAWLCSRMNLSYSYLSKIFSDTTYTSIENYLIMLRIERVKKLVIEEKMTFSEVAWKLNYSSIAHLSNQFKKTTGMTPTMFQKIIERRSRLHADW
jgi:AraC-like DNA-binding protein